MPFFTFYSIMPLMRWGRHNRISLEDAQASFLAKTRQGDNGCLIWTGALGSHKRYGICGVAGRHWLAHRAALFLFRGIDPQEQVVRHKCDNGLCVNIDHLELGTQKDNVADAETRGRARHPSAENHGRAKLTWEQVREIRACHAAGEAIRALARRFPVDRTNISRIVKGKGWLPNNTS